MECRAGCALPEDQDIKDESVRTLQALLAKYPGYRDAEMLLGELSKKEKKPQINRIDTARFRRRLTINIFD